MGYETEFIGVLIVSPALGSRHYNYLQKFSDTRRMERDETKTKVREDPIREAIDLPVGPDGGYFVGEDGYKGQDDGFDVTDPNKPPQGQPSLWCHWAPETTSTISCDGPAKYSSAQAHQWIQYLIANFFEPWGYKLNGVVTWQGEDICDRGEIHVKDNIVDTTRLETNYTRRPD